MADLPDQDAFSAQMTDNSDYNAVGGAVEGVADNTDSDDYDPSMDLQEDSPVPFHTSEENTTAPPSDTIVSPVASSLHPLPPRPVNGPSPSIQTSSSRIQAFAPTVTASSQPRMRGGFEIDDDDDLEAQEDNDDSKDVLDVYDPVDGTDGDLGTPAPVPELSVNSVSPSTKQVNGVALTASSKDVMTGASGLVLSPVHPATVLPQRATTATPVQNAVDAQTQASAVATNVNASLAPTLPKARLAHDTIGILEDRIKEDSRGDFTAWLELIADLKSRNKDDEVRKLYNRFFAVFPHAAEQWCDYVKWEEEHDRKYEMEQLFSKSLLEVPDVELWTIYINYIRRRNSMQTGDVNKSYKIINDSFSFALDKVGIDKDSGRLWQDYIDFIKSSPGQIGGNGWQDAQKMDTLRAAYQRAISVPTSALNTLWKEYDAFETGLSKINGRKYLQDKSPAYMTARSSYIQLQNMTKDLIRTSRPRLPPAAGFEGDIEYAQQVDLWKQWIKWEKDDNLVLKEDEVATYRSRILFTYKQALMALQYWPEMWYDAAEFCFSIGDSNEGMKFLTQGIEANPESCLLAFRLADRIELEGTNDQSSDPGAKQRMAKVREPYDKVLDALYELITKTRIRETQEIQRIEQRILEENGVTEVEGDYMSVTQESRREAAKPEIDAVKQNAFTQTELLRKTISYCWVALMRAARRIQGKGLPTERGGGFRAVFADSRKKGKITSDVYVESALIEYHCYKDPAGTKIFERGMKLFPEDERFTYEYLKHLIAINDITNARAVFETTVGKLTANSATVEKAKPLFSFFHEYESHFGELSQIVRLEQRISELYPNDLGLKQFNTRFASSTFDPTTITPVLSSQQLRPKNDVQPSIEQAGAVNSPITRLIDSINTNSPKRPFPSDDFEESLPRKLARGESPLKGAAGRRMNQQQRQVNGLPSAMPQAHVAIPPPLPNQITYLLSIIPKSSSYLDTRFDAGKMVDLLRETRLPPSIAMQQQRDHPPPPQQPPAWQQPPPMMPPGYLPPPGMSQPNFGAAPFRYA